MSHYDHTAYNNWLHSQYEPEDKPKAHRSNTAVVYIAEVGEPQPTITEQEDEQRQNEYLLTHHIKF